MKVYKDNLVREIQDNLLEEYITAGWTQQIQQETAGEEVIRLKPTVKAKNTAKILDDITTQGDE